MNTNEGQNEALKQLRHSAAHVLGAAVLRLFPTAKYDIGPAIDNGFYYDFDLPRTLTAKDLDDIETQMKHIQVAKVYLNNRGIYVFAIQEKNIA